MARFVLASRRAGKFTTGEKLAARASMDALVAGIGGGVTILEDSAPQDPVARRVIVVDSTDGAALRLAASLPPDVIMEPEILHYPGSLLGSLVPPADFAGAGAHRLDGPANAGPATGLAVRVTGSGRPLEGARVTAFLRGFGGVERRVSAVTGADGRATLAHGGFFQVSALRVDPAGGHWGMLVRGPSGVVEVDCPPLPQDGPIAWWHRAHGVSAFRPEAGRGIRVGVIDTGVGPHPALAAAVSIGAFIGGETLPAEEGLDVDSHGTHVCGIIGARPIGPGDPAGIAPGAELLSARVFPPGEGANQADIANAIDALSRDHGVDLINMSLGAPQGSEIERDAIIDAFERGTLCICAAANSAGPVEYPAAFPETVAVSALGLLGWGPAGSVAASRVPEDRAKFGTENLFLANFSCFGPEIDCAAPGVGIVATVPERFGLVAPHAAFDGTSMASPAACGALAVALSLDAGYAALPRDQTRASHARRILAAACRDLGMAAAFQGRGIPTAPPEGAPVA